MKKIMIFLLALSILLSSFDISLYANESNNTTSNDYISPYNDFPTNDGGKS